LPNLILTNCVKNCAKMLKNRIGDED
jgi:hypothetical protein